MRMVGWRLVLFGVVLGTLVTVVGAQEAPVSPADGFLTIFLHGFAPS